MTWFRVDDGFYDHPKSHAAGPAVALWLRAGCWSARQLTDGFIPRRVLRTIRGGTPAMAARLVEARAYPGGAGLWLPTADGWQFHDWFDWQPSRKKVEEERVKRAASGRLGGVRSGESRRGSARDARADLNGCAHESEQMRALIRSKGRTNPTPGDDGYGDEPAGHSDIGTESSEASASALLHTKTNPRPGPARPTNPLLRLAGSLTYVGDQDPDACLPDWLIMEWQVLAGPGVDLVDEARAYLARYGDTHPVNPRAAWLGWLRKARPAVTYAPPRTQCSAPGCVDGWLPDDPSTGLAVPCRSCRPHLRAVPTESEAS